MIRTKRNTTGRVRFKQIQQGNSEIEESCFIQAAECWKQAILLLAQSVQLQPYNAIIFSVPSVVFVFCISDSLGDGP